jgi:hypothetical protein
MTTGQAGAAAARRQRPARAGRIVLALGVAAVAFLPAAPAQAAPPPHAASSVGPTSPAAPHAARKVETPKPPNAARKGETPKPPNAARKVETPKPPNAARKGETPKPPATAGKGAPTSRKPPATGKGASTSQKPQPATRKSAPTSQKPPATGKGAPTSQKPQPATGEAAPATPEPAPAAPAPPVTRQRASTTREGTSTTREGAVAPTADEPATPDGVEPDRPTREAAEPKAEPGTRGDGRAARTVDSPAPVAPTPSELTWRLRQAGETLTEPSAGPAPAAIVPLGAADRAPATTTATSPARDAASALAATTPDRDAASAFAATTPDRDVALATLPANASRPAGTTAVSGSGRSRIEPVLAPVRRLTSQLHERIASVRADPSPVRDFGLPVAVLALLGVYLAVTRWSGPGELPMTVTETRGDDADLAL